MLHHRLMVQLLHYIGTIPELGPIIAIPSPKKQHINRLKFKGSHIDKKAVKDLATEKLWLQNNIKIRHTRARNCIHLCLALK